MDMSIKAVVLTGQPGIGKTTLIKSLCEDLRKSHGAITTAGFFTEEVRSAKGRNEHKSRIGFDVVTLDGKRGVLARDTPFESLHCRKVGKYSVFTSDFENIILPLFNTIPDLFVIDEIGKMELLSTKFEQKLNMLLDNAVPLLATVPLQTRVPLPVVHRLISAETTKLYKVNEQNRDLLKDNILNNIKQMLKVD